jgi:hypothetical protein
LGSCSKQWTGQISKDKRLHLLDSEKLGYRLFYSIYPISEKVLLLGTSEGLMKITVNNHGDIEKVEELMKFH